MHILTAWTSTKQTTPLSAGKMDGLMLTFLLALAAFILSRQAWLAALGPLIVAILLGIGVSYFFQWPASASPGISFSAKELLRVGIILFGLRLDFSMIIHSGAALIGFSALNILITLLVVYLLGRKLQLDPSLALLLASGTSICGASAIAAVGSQTSARQEAITISVVTIAILGTACTIALSLLYPLLDLSAAEYGLFAGLTLHEIAHVMAASSPAGENALDLALLAKLCRVSLLVLVSVGIQVWLSHSTGGVSTDSTEKKQSFPWFIIGFLFMGGIQSLHIVPPFIVNGLLFLGTFLITMAMAAMGLAVNASLLKRFGLKPLLAVIAGTLLLFFLGFLEIIFLT